MKKEEMLEITELDNKSLRSLIKYYQGEYAKVTNDINDNGWTVEKRDRANILMKSLSDLEWALHYNNIMNSDDNFSAEFHNVCRKRGRR